MKIAMINLFAALQKSGLEAKILLQVHDELLLECPENERNETIILVQCVMENAYQFKYSIIDRSPLGVQLGKS